VRYSACSISKDASLLPLYYCYNAGEALFLPALWSHAVVSTPAKEEDVSRGLNIAVNIWFVQRSLSHAAALKHHPEWTQGWFVYANDLRAAGLRNPLNNILYVYIYTHI